MLPYFFFFGGILIWGGPGPLAPLVTPMATNDHTVNQYW